MNSTMGSPLEPSGAVPVGKGGVRERAQFSPQAETELSGLYDDALRQFPLALHVDKQMQIMAVMIARALTQRWKETGLGVLYPAIDQLPEPVLDILAYDLKADWYDYGYSLEEKRRTLKDAWKVHRIKGTKAAVETAISAIYPGTQVQEWWEYGGEPFCFRLFLNAGELRPDTEKHKKVLEKVNYYKSLRSHLDGFIWSFTGEPFIETPEHLVFRRFVLALKFSSLRGIRFNGAVNFGDDEIFFDQIGDGIGFPHFRISGIRFPHFNSGIRFDGDANFDGGIAFNQSYGVMGLPSLRMNGKFFEERERIHTASLGFAVRFAKGCALNGSFNLDGSVILDGRGRAEAVSFQRFSASAAFRHGRERLRGKAVMDNWHTLDGGFSLDGSKNLNAYIKEEEL